MKETFEEHAGFAINDDGDMAVRMLAAANQVYSLYVYNDWVQKQCFPQTAMGEYLDYHAQMRGLERREAAKAQGVLRFLIPDPLGTDKTITQGTICLNGAGESFQTTEDAIIPAGALYGDAAAEAMRAGVAGNAAAGTIVYMTLPPVGVSACTNPSRFVGGEEAETDESLRERIIHSFNTLPNGANAAYYEKQVMSHENVAAVQVVPKARGLGTVDIIVSSGEGLPGEGLLEEIRTDLNEKREICVSIEVSAPMAKTVDMKAAVQLEDGYEFAAVSVQLEKAIADYFDGTLLGKDILRVKLGDILYQVPGVKNYVLSKPEQDVAVNPQELPVLGALTLEEWS